MVGLSVVLEAHNTYSASSTATPTSTVAITKKTLMPLVISKATVVIPTSPPSNPSSASRSFHFSHGPPPSVGGSFLDACFLCRQRLLPGKDIYMYKGDKAFCSEECRWKQMLMEESNEENSTPPPPPRRKSIIRGNDNYIDNCSLAAIKPTSSSATRPRHQLLHRRNPFAS